MKGKKENKDFRHTEAYCARRNAELKKIGIFLAVGFAYLLWRRFSGIGIPCVFHLLTTLECPGCGITRAIVALSRLDIQTAFHYNKLSITVFPLFVLVLVCREYRFIKTGDRNASQKKVRNAETILLTILFVATVFYGIWRNLPTLKVWYTYGLDFIHHH